MEGELKRVAQAALKTRPNFAYTLEEVKADVRRVFNTGWFKECNPDAIDTRDGVKLIITVGRRLARVHAYRTARCACDAMYMARDMDMDACGQISVSAPLPPIWILCLPFIHNC